LDARTFPVYLTWFLLFRVSDSILPESAHVYTTITSGARLSEESRADAFRQSHQIHHGQEIDRFELAINGRWAADAR
jgi:hypothetical protein